MTSTPVSTFERALQRDGDDLYRLALLLAPDTPSAEAALLRVAQQVARADIIDDVVLIEALLHALPAELPQRRPRAPAWTRAESLLQAVAGLPRTQRLALALALLRDWEPPRAAPFFAGDATQFQREARDALVALGRSQAGSGKREAGSDTETSKPAVVLAFSDLTDPASAPSECQPTRAMLALAAATGARDPGQRGHLALCAACRAAEHAWQQLTATVEQALRGALRDQHLPATLAEKLRAAAHAEPVTLRPRRIDIHWLRWVLPLLVIGLIAALIFPRQQAKPALVSTAATPPQPPRELVQRALERLYAPPADAAYHGAVWHGQWQIRWVFNDQSAATLNADAWIDPASSRHRVQLVHEAGGGPYEFELADGSATALYAVTPNYNAQLYLSDFATNSFATRLRTTIEQQRALLQARMESGAWSIAANYLRQAQAARELQSWGRQQAPDGTPLDIVSFRGSSPLGLPVGTPNVPTNATTLLLSLDARDGTLHEISEVSGPADGEQTRQIVWRFTSGEWLQAPDQISAAFDVRQAWNGTARFPEREQALLNPALPLSTANDFLPVANILINRWAWGVLPTALPPGTTSAALIRSAAPDKDGALYIGAGRRLAVQRFWENPQDILGVDANNEQLRSKGFSVTLRPRAPQSYSILLDLSPANDVLPQSQLVLVQATGYTRAEILDIMNTLGPLTPQMFAAQAPLFTDALTQSSDVRDTLIRALGAPADPGVRHTIERHFVYPAAASTDLLPDPYHMPVPKTSSPIAYEIWFRRLLDGKGEISTTIRDEQQTYIRGYDSPSGAWNHDLVRDEVQSYKDDGNGADGLTNMQRQALTMLSCPNVQLEQAPTGHILSTIETNWPYDSCMHPDYGALLRDQSNNSSNARALGWSPFIAGAMRQSSVAAPPPLITRLHLDGQGRPFFVDTHFWAESGVLLESWESVSDTYVSDEQLPAGTFVSQPPAAFVTDAYTEGEPRSTIHTVALTEARTLLSAPLWMLPPDPQYPLIRTEAGNRVASNRIHLDDPIDDAIEHGLAVRLRYKLANDRPQPLLHLVQGDATTFGAFLRARAWWQSSDAIQFTFGERTIAGWRVKTKYGRVWTLFALDGTLIAADVDPLSDTAEAAPVALLERLVR